MDMKTHGLTEGLITYSQRYMQCIECTFLFKHIMMSSSEGKVYYSQVDYLKNYSEEIAFLRVGPNEPWENHDFRLAACSFALETKRRVIFHIEQNFRHTVPDEFQDLVVTLDSNSIRSTIKSFNDAKLNGDLVASLLLLESGASKGWVFEADVRLVGHWGHFLMKKRRTKIMIVISIFGKDKLLKNTRIMDGKLQDGGLTQCVTMDHGVHPISLHQEASGLWDLVYPKHLLKL
jgi:hypothetical protein